MELGIHQKISFKSDYYKFKKHGNNCYMTSIKTDDKPEEGKQLLIKINNKKPSSMTYDGKYYVYNLPKSASRVASYEILNKENRAVKVNPDILKLSKSINLYGNCTEQIFAKGSAKGLLVTDLNNIPQDKPVIVMIDGLQSHWDIYGVVSRLKKNVQGVILNNIYMGILDHAAAVTRQYCDVAHAIFDNKKYNELKALVGKNIAISNESGAIEYSVIDKLPELADIRFKTPDIPILEEETRLLDFSKLTRKNSGEKAYRIGVMQKLVKDGYLSDVEIPQGFVIPVGYINKVYEYLNSIKDDNIDYKILQQHPMNEELARICQQYGMQGDDILVRSAFNTEDLSDYPTAGIYASYKCRNYGDIVRNIYYTVLSKDKAPAVLSRERYGIPDSIVQPCVIVQKYQKTNFPFTLYTDTDDGKLKLEMRYQKAEDLPSSDWAVISYDRKTGKIELESTHNIDGNYLIKDTGEIVEQHLMKNEIQKNWKSLLVPLKIAINNALKLEKYFGRPQDIEGGINNGRVYLWQARDIGKKAICK